MKSLVVAGESREALLRPKRQLATRSSASSDARLLGSRASALPVVVAAAAEERHIRTLEQLLERGCGCSLVCGLGREITRERAQPGLERQSSALQDDAANGRRAARLDAPVARREEVALVAELALQALDALLLAEEARRPALDLHAAGKRAVELVCEHLHERPQVAARGAQRRRRQVEVVLIVGHPGVACARIGHARRLDVPRSRRTVQIRRKLMTLGSASVRQPP